MSRGPARSLDGDSDGGGGIKPRRDYVDNCRWMAYDTPVCATLYAIAVRGHRQSYVLMYSSIHQYYVKPETA
jgi:hypothetical protein